MACRFESSNCHFAVVAARRLKCDDSISKLSNRWSRFCFLAFGPQVNGILVKKRLLKSEKLKPRNNQNTNYLRGRLGITEAQRTQSETRTRGILISENLLKEAFQNGIRSKRISPHPLCSPCLCVSPSSAFSGPPRLRVSPSSPGIVPAWA